MNKIITLRGTSGAGKSHIVRSIMSQFPKREPVFRPNRKQPLYYLMSRHEKAELAVLGHYESPCGGCDTIQEASEVYDLVVAQFRAGTSVLFEGVLLGGDVNRTKAVADMCGEPVHCIFLQTPIEQCLESINERRRARGVVEPVNPDNTIKKFKNVARAMERMKTEAPNVITYALDRAAALSKIQELLGL